MSETSEAIETRETYPPSDSSASPAAPGGLGGFVLRVLEAASSALPERPGARVRRVRRLGRQPLPMLYDLFPEARLARPRQVGLRTLDVTDIAGTAVAGAAQRGGDFLPLRDFRSPNWETRWQRIRRAFRDLAVLPPINVFLYDGSYWVEDGHNRVAVALYGGQLAIDASVTELVPPGARATEPITLTAAEVSESLRLRAAGNGRLTATADHAASVGDLDRLADELPEPVTLAELDATAD